MTSKLEVGHCWSILRSGGNAARGFRQAVPDPQVGAEVVELVFASGLLAAKAEERNGQLLAMARREGVLV